MQPAATTKTHGEILYGCLVQVKPMQFREGATLEDPAGYESRTPWTELTEQSQWSKGDWERIAQEYLCTGLRSGALLYDCVYDVCPTQRRQSGFEVPRSRWSVLSPMNQTRWGQVAELFVTHLETVAFGVIK